MKRFLLFPLLFLAILTAQAEATHLSVEHLDSTEATSALAQIGKIVLSYDDMCLYDKEGNKLGCTPYAQIDKIVFYKEGATGLDNTADSHIQVVLNPAEESLSIRGIEGEQTIRIYSMQGHLILSAGSVNGEANLSVGGMPNGTYLLQVGAQMMKFVKK